MKKISFLMVVFLIFLGCAGKGINIYINEPTFKESTNLRVYDQRKNPNVIGYIYSRGEIVGDITFSTELDRYILASLSDIKKDADIYIKKLEIVYDKSKVTGENLKGKISIKVEFIKNQKKLVRVINIERSRWIAPIKSAKAIQKFTKDLIDEAIRHLKRILK